MKSQIFDSLTFLADCYPHSKVTQATLENYTELLSEDFSADELKAAFRIVTKRCDFFPTIAQITEAVRGSDLDSAHESVGRILKAVQAIGPYRTVDAVSFLGKDWSIVEKFGGWQMLCAVTNSELPSVRAQLRDIARSNHRRSEYTQSEAGLKKLDFSSLKLIDV